MTTVTVSQNDLDKNIYRGNTNIDGVILDGTVTAITDYSFILCTNLKSITITDNVISIGSYAFQNCYKLNNIQFNNTYRFTDFITATQHLFIIIIAANYCV